MADVSKSAQTRKTLANNGDRPAFEGVRRSIGIGVSDDESSVEVVVDVQNLYKQSTHNSSGF